MFNVEGDPKTHRRIAKDVMTMHAEKNIPKDIRLGMVVLPDFQLRTFIDVVNETRQNLQIPFPTADDVKDSSNIELGDIKQLHKNAIEICRHFDAEDLELFKEQVNKPEIEIKLQHLARTFYLYLEKFHLLFEIDHKNRQHDYTIIINRLRKSLKNGEIPAYYARVCAKLYETLAVFEVASGSPILRNIFEMIKDGENEKIFDEYEKSYIIVGIYTFSSFYHKLIIL